MCSSLRGLLYYAASFHISIGFLFLVGFFVDLLGVAEIWHNPYATYFSLILSLLYIGLFITFGLLIFRGVENESVRLLKGSLTGFITLQISAFMVYLLLLAITNSVKNSKRAADSVNDSPDSVDDFGEIEATLQGASIELQRNLSHGIKKGITIGGKPPSTESDPLLVKEEQQIISIYQIIIIILGGLTTFCYSTAVVLFVKEISGTSDRI